MRYRRLRIPGGAYFFTVVTAGRAPVFADANAVDRLREAFRTVRRRSPFEIDAIVVLPDHLHAVWRLPDGDDDFPGRWRRIKAGLTRGLRREGGDRAAIWQDRYWEHWLRDEEDWQRHVDYIHANPVRHGLVTDVRDWPWSSIHAWIRDGRYGSDPLPAAAKEPGPDTTGED